jgi:hypothetical protein
MFSSGNMCKLHTYLQYAEVACDARRRRGHLETIHLFYFPPDGILLQFYFAFHNVTKIYIRKIVCSVSYIFSILVAFYLQLDDKINWMRMCGLDSSR